MRIQHRPVSALVRSATLVGAALTAVSVYAADWSDWQAVPDHYQGKVSFRLKSAGKKGGYQFELQNGYDQKVTVKFLITGVDAANAPQREERTLALDPGAQNIKDDSQTIPFSQLSGAALEEIHFSGHAPQPTLGGFYAPSILIPALKRALEDARKAQERADALVTAANAEQASVQASANSSASGVQTRGSDGNLGVTGGAQKGEVQSAQEDSKDAAAGAQRIHAAVISLEKQLKEAQAADAVARSEGEKAFQAAQSGAPVTASQPVTTISSPVAVTAPTVAGTPANKATLTVDQMKTDYKTAQDAFAKKDWAGAETALEALLAGGGDSIKDKDRGILNFRLGLAYDNDGKPAKAEPAYAEAVRLGVKDDALLNNLATVQYAQKEYAAAEKSERSAIEIKSDSVDYYFNLGLICRAQNKLSDAESAYKSALKLDPDNENIKKHLKAVQDAEKATP